MFAKWLTYTSAGCGAWGPCYGWLKNWRSSSISISSSTKVADADRPLATLITIAASSLIRVHLPRCRAALRCQSVMFRELTRRRRRRRRATVCLCLADSVLPPRPSSRPPTVHSRLLALPPGARAVRLSRTRTTPVLHCRGERLQHLDDAAAAAAHDRQTSASFHYTTVSNHSPAVDNSQPMLWLKTIFAITFNIATCSHLHTDQKIYCTVSSQCGPQKRATFIFTTTLANVDQF